MKIHRNEDDPPAMATTQPGATGAPTAFGHGRECSLPI